MQSKKKELIDARLIDKGGKKLYNILRKDYKKEVRT